MTGLIILAAGASRRLGRPKQLLTVQGKSLLQHAVSEGLASKCGKVIVVLGANEKEIQASLAGPTITVVVNEDWESGMASTIRCGLEELQSSAPEVTEALIMVCDQPFVNAGLLNKLITNKKKTDKQVVACSYDNSLGTPAIFDKALFNDLKALKGDQGAKKIILRYTDQAYSIPFAFGNIDIDTESDYKKLLARL